MYIAETPGVRLPHGHLCPDGPHPALHIRPLTSKPQLLFPGPTAQARNFDCSPLLSIKASPGFSLRNISPSQPASYSSGRVLRVLQGSAPHPSNGTSSSVSAPVTQPPKGSLSSLSEMQTWLCCPCLKRRRDSPLPSAPLCGPALAPPARYWVIPFWNSLSGPPESFAASSWPYSLADDVLSASSVLAFLIMVTKLPSSFKCQFSFPRRKRCLP